MMSDKSKRNSLDDGGRIKMGSDRNFGIVFAVVFLILACLPLLNDKAPNLWLMGVSGAFLLIALVYPRVLRPLNRAWFLFGLLLHKIVSPIIVGLVFYGVFVPIGLLMRVFGKDPLRRKFDAAATTYWIERDPAGPEPETMKHQF